MVCRPVDLKCVDKDQDKTWYRVTTYLLCGVIDTTVPGPTIYLEELGLVLKEKLVGKGVSCHGSPLKKLIGCGCSIAWDKPFPCDICVELYFMGVPIVNGNLHGEVGKRNRLVDKICRLDFYRL